MRSRKGIERNLFLHPMSRINFLARNYGELAVLLEKSNVKGGAPAGKIIFHKPHPGSKIDHTTPHHMGKNGQVVWLV